jgi:hypothetical protein
MKMLKEILEHVSSNLSMCDRDFRITHSLTHSLMELSLPSEAAISE